MVTCTLGRLAIPEGPLRDAVHKPGIAMSTHPDIVTVLPSTLPHTALWTPGSVLNQESEPWCTEYAAHDHLDASPHAHADIWNAEFPNAGDFYVAEKAIDGLPSGAEGSTSAAMNKVLQDHHLIDAVLWAFDEWTVRKWVLTQGPVSIGIDWWNSMFYPDPADIVHVNADEPANYIAGGHELLIVGYDYFGYGKLAKGQWGLYMLQNSWGPDWGEKGFCYMSHGDLAYLLSSDGDASATLNWSGIPGQP